MAKLQWYYAQNGQQHGPVTSIVLKELVASGRLIASDLVWKEGMSAWVPTTRVRGLFPDSPLDQTHEAANSGVGMTKGSTPAPVCRSLDEVDREVNKLLAQRDTVVLNNAGCLIHDALNELCRLSAAGVMPTQDDSQEIGDLKHPEANLTKQFRMVDEGLKRLGELRGKLAEANSHVATHEARIRQLERELRNPWYWLLEKFFGGTRGKQIVECARHIPECKRPIPKIEAAIDKMLHQLRALANNIDAYMRAIPDSVSPAINEVRDQIAELYRLHSPSLVAAWDDSTWDAWKPDPSVRPFDELRLRVGSLIENRLETFNVLFGRVAIQRTVAITKATVLPAYVPFIGANQAIVVRCTSANEAEALAVFQALLLRVATVLPHQASFTLLDPSGHGQAFPMRRYLPSVRESREDVYRELAEVVARTRHILQNVLGFVEGFHLLPEATLAGESYEFVFAANFPRGYDRRAVETLFNLAGSGPKAGRYVFLHWNTDVPLPHGISAEELSNAWELNLNRVPTIRPHYQLVLDRLPDGGFQREILQRLEEAKPPEHAIEWEQIVDRPSSEWWTSEYDATEMIRTPVGGPNGELKIWFGVNDGRPCAHGMLAAMTGQGKSNLYHALILGLATRYSPEDLRFYLIDGKDGVEFEIYQNLPHAAVVSLKTSPDLSRSVLTELIEEKERRNSLLSQHKVNDFTEYRKLTQGKDDSERLPRILLLIDEYQELFEDDPDGIASQELLQLAQQGRSAGIHLLLGSQRFGAPGMLNQAAIFGNIHLRMALKMSHEDVQGLSVFGPVGRDLIRSCDLPGKIVINDQTGDDTGNHFGKVARISPEIRKRRIKELAEKASQEGLLTHLGTPIAFKGAEQPKLSENPHLDRLWALPKRYSPQELASIARKSIVQKGFGTPHWVATERPVALWLGQEC